EPCPEMTQPGCNRADHRKSDLRTSEIDIKGFYSERLQTLHANVQLAGSVELYFRGRWKRAVCVQVGGASRTCCPEPCRQIIPAMIRRHPYADLCGLGHCLVSGLQG